MSEVKFIPNENTITLDEEGICELVIENRGKAIIYKVRICMLIDQEQFRR